MTPEHEWCDMRMLSKVCALSERTVKGCIGSLEKKGLISVNKDMKTYRYQINDKYAASDVWFKTNMAAMGQNGKNWLNRRSVHKKFVIADAPFLSWLAGQGLKAETWRVFMACMRRLDFNRCTVGYGNGILLGLEDISEMAEAGIRAVKEALKHMVKMELVLMDDGKITFNPLCVIKGVRVFLSTYEMFKDTIHTKRYNDWMDAQMADQ